jgi:diguanylate cyclase (GGDEF)-like protein
MSSLVLLMIRLHNGPMTRRAIAHVLVPALVVTAVSTTVAVGVLLLNAAGPLGDVVLAAATGAGLVLYRTYLGMRRRHAALELVHDFVTGSAGADSFAAAARELLPRIRTLLRAGSVEMLVLPSAAEDSTSQSSAPDGTASDGSATDGTAPEGSVFVDTDAGFRTETASERRRDWAVLRAVHHGEPLLAPRSSKDRAVLGWLREHRFRDAMVVPFPATSGVTGTITVSDRLGETATFTDDDLTLLQTLTGHLAVASTGARMVEQLAYDAGHDSLTALANRAALVRRISEQDAGRSGYVAVMVMDLDRFKEVNDALGHAAGDAVLKIVGERLRSVLPPTALAARLGGDEFAMHLCDLTGPEQARIVAEKVAAELARPFSIHGAVLNAEASIGVAVALAGSQGRSSIELMRRADTAMYVAKASDEPVALYDPDMDRGRAENLALLADLRVTLRNHPEQFTLYFQPKLDLRTREVIGAEALVRWNHPTLGVLAPDRFIPLAETSGLIQQFTPLVLSRALTECRRWAAHGAAVSVAVNLSPRNVGDATLPRQIEAALSDADMPAGRLIVEITESSILVDPDHALRVLGEIADLGVAISLDDFGTGYSSLSYLHRFPAREVKIDKSFVQDLADAGTSHALVTAIVDLGRSLDLRVVAEGAETAEVLDLLARLGCEAAQGYTIARPLPADEFLEWLVENRSRQSASLQLRPAG